MISSWLPLTLPHCHTLGNEQDRPPVVLLKLGHLRSVLDCRLLSVGQWNAQGPASAIKFPANVAEPFGKQGRVQVLLWIDERNPHPINKRALQQKTTISFHHDFGGKSNEKF